MSTTLFDSVPIFVQSINETLTYHVGRNAAGNFALIDASDPDDYWFHVDGHPSCHVVVSMKDDDDNPFIDKKEKHAILVQGAVLCKSRSKLKGNKRVTIVYAKISDIRKTDVVGSVEVLKPYFLII